jgi:hypothetical protein
MPISYIAVEGQHDAALIGCLLSNGGFRLVKKRSKMKQVPAFERLVPTEYPENLIGRPPECVFWQRQEHTIGVHPVGGDSQLIVAGATVTAQISGPISSLGFFIDADQETPATRLLALTRDIQAMNPEPGFQFPAEAGQIHQGSPRCGVFVFPNNQDQGAIEAVLESCAEVAYPDLFTKSRAYLQGIDRQQLTETERNRLGTGSNEKKARLSVIGSVLRPAAAIQNTIRDDRWICEETKDLALVANIRTFLRDLLDEGTI